MSRRSGHKHKWEDDQKAVEARIDDYYGAEGAQRFYDSFGEVRRGGMYGYDDPDYIEGYSMGNSAEVPPEDLNDVGDPASRRALIEGQVYEVEDVDVSSLLRDDSYGDDPRTVFDGQSVPRDIIGHLVEKMDLNRVFSAGTGNHSPGSMANVGKTISKAKRPKQKELFGKGDISDRFASRASGYRPFEQSTRYVNYYVHEGGVSEFPDEDSWGRVSKESYSDCESSHITDEADILGDQEASRDSFREGYIDGLRDFAKSMGINTYSRRFQGLERKFFEDDVEFLKDDDFFYGFIRGIGMEDPESLFSGNRTAARERSDPWIDRAELIQEGYMFGFTIAIVRDYEHMMDREDVPLSEIAYDAFMQGMTGMPREMPDDFFEIVSSARDHKMRGAGTDYSRFQGVEAGLAWLCGVSDEKSYMKGIGIWLEAEGLEGVHPRQIRHPEAMRAFQAAINGERLREYEPRLVGGRLITGQEYKYQGIIKDNFEPTYIIPLAQQKGPSPMEIAQRCGQDAYDLGKAIRAKSDQ